MPANNIESNTQLTRLVVTRPKQHSLSFIDEAKSRGFEAAALPVLEIEPVTETAQKQAIKNQILRFDEFEAVIFVSQNAVQYGFNWLEDYWPQLPQGIQYFGVGTKTESAIAERLANLGAENALVSHSDASSKMDSESLLQHPSLLEVENKKILIFRGVGGRTKLYEELSSRGAQVEHCELYERQIPARAKETLSEIKIDPLRDLIVLFSAESLQNFHALIEGANLDKRKACHLLTPSERVAKQAKNLSYTHVHTALNASEESMWQAIEPLMQKQQ